MDIQIQNEKLKLQKLKHQLKSKRVPTEAFLPELLPGLYAEKCEQYRFPSIPKDTLNFKSIGRPPSLQKLKSASNSETRVQRPTSKGDHSSITSSHEGFEEKLFNGVLTVPQLNLERVPKSIFNFEPPLRIIYLNDNALKELQENFFDDLPLLAWLDLRNNRLQSLPELKNKHKALRTMLLQNNQITRLPYSLFRAEALKSVLLRGNPLKDPPKRILETGIEGILPYLKQRFEHPDEAESADEESSESEIDEDMSSTFSSIFHKKEALQNVSKQHLENSSATSFSSFGTGNEQVLPKSKALKIIYSDEIWKHVPYNGPNAFKILAQAQKDLRDRVERQLTQQKQALLQKIKDAEARSIFHIRTKQLQANGEAKRKASVYKGPKYPFGINSNCQNSESEIQKLPFDNYRHEFGTCWDKLNDFIANPISLSNVEAARNRLKEVEEVYKKLSNMRLSMKTNI